MTVVVVDRDILERALGTLGDCGAYFDSLDAADAHRQLTNPTRSLIALACDERVAELADVLGVGREGGGPS